MALQPQFGIGVALVVISIPLVARMVPRNRVYGVRTRKAFASDRNWYEINAYGGKRLIVWSSALALIGIAAFFIPLDEGNPTGSALSILLAFSPLIVVIPAIIEIISFSRKL